MKALVYTGPEAIEFRDVPDPVPGPQDEIVRIASVGICGSDMHAYLGHDDRRPAPLILGHEAAGTVEDGPNDGLRVTINPLVTCGACKACRSGHDNVCAGRQIISMPPREGAFAEQVAIPRNNLVEVPAEVPMEKAALTEPMACGWHAVRLGLAALGEIPESALILGGGAIGLGAALAARAQGVTGIRIVEPHAGRRATLERSGMDAVPPEDLEPGAFFDLVIDGVGYANTRKAASAHVRPGGVITHVGLGEAEGGLDVRRLTLQEITFIGTYAYAAQDFRDTAMAIFDGRLGPLDWTEMRPLADGAGAFRDIRAGRVDAPKIILCPEGGPA
ncbi:MAG: alcohol dehydrogenase catalytic domain-containing protein [Boseongicola sp. SB0662_bin_57]|nr:alcohol dehydrogenase catalytic domain-containing protein [Boseongicola sp. SB0662_bin_57]